MEMQKGGPERGRRSYSSKIRVGMCLRLRVEHGTDSSGRRRKVATQIKAKRRDSANNGHGNEPNQDGVFRGCGATFLVVTFGESKPGPPEGRQCS